MIFQWTATLSAGTCWNTTESMRFSEPKEPKGPEAWCLLVKKNLLSYRYLYDICIYGPYIDRYCNKYTISHSHCSYKAAYSGWYWWLQACDSQKDQGWLRRVWPPRAIERMRMMMGLPMDYHICSWWWLITFNYQWVYQWIMMIIWVYQWVYQW